MSDRWGLAPGLLEGRVALVTGGGRGLGQAIAEALLEAGATVVVCGRSEPTALPEANGRTALFAPCDIRNAEEVAGLVGGVIERCGRLDILVNNAGGSPPA